MLHLQSKHRAQTKLPFVAGDLAVINLQPNVSLPPAFRRAFDHVDIVVHTTLEAQGALAPRRTMKTHVINTRSQQ